MANERQQMTKTLACYVLSTSDITLI